MAQKANKHRMAAAFKPSTKGKLHRQLNVPEGEPIPAKKLAAAKKKANKMGDTHMKRELALAATGKKIAGQDRMILGRHGQPMGGHCGMGC